MKGLNSIVLSGLICLSIFWGSLGSPLLADEYKDAQKAYEAAQYDQALNLLITKLRKDNDHSKAVELFKTTLNLVVDSHQKAAQEAEAQQDWEKAINEYQTLEKVKADVESINPIEKVKIDGKKIERAPEIPVISVDTKLAEAHNNAAELYFLRAETTFGKEDYKQAIKEYLLALGHVKPYKDSKEKISESYYRIAQNCVTKKDYREASVQFKNADDITNGYKDAKASAVANKAMADEKDAQTCYEKGTSLAEEGNFRDASTQFKKATSFVSTFKDAQVLATKYKTMADEEDAQACYEKGTSLAETGNFRDASAQFKMATSFVSTFKDAQALATKYKTMADEKDAQACYERGQTYLSQNDFKAAEKEFLAANGYIKGFKDALTLAQKAKSAMPDETQITNAVKGALKQSIPISWVGNLMGGSNAKLQTVEVVKIGIYNDRERYWPMRVHVVGTCQLNDPFNQGKTASFDQIGEFVFTKDDYGEWVASMRGGMFQ